MNYDLLVKMAEGMLAPSPATGRAAAGRSDFEFQPYSFRRGVTLIELLVVISIMLLLAAYALPKLEPMAKERKIREAARSVTVFLDRARSRAIETGRPCGVIFARADNTPNASVMLYQAEVPPPYAGDTLDTRINTITYTGGAITGTITPALSVVPKAGDLLQINNQGIWYKILPGITATSFTLEVPLQYQNSLPWGTATNVSLPFKILRQPQRTIAQPVNLPVGTAVDLSVSGTDALPTLFDDVSGASEVKIMFSPNGSVKQYNGADATDSVYFLIGWREQTGISGTDTTYKPWHEEDVDEETLPNWQVLSNLWIALNPQTGLITVAENTNPDTTYKNVDTDPKNYRWDQDSVKKAAMVESRKYARQAQSKGGR